MLPDPSPVNLRLRYITKSLLLCVIFCPQVSDFVYYRTIRWSIHHGSAETMRRYRRWFGCCKVTALICLLVLCNFSYCGKPHKARFLCDALQARCPGSIQAFQTLVKMSVFWGKKARVPKHKKETIKFK